MYSRFRVDGWPLCPMCEHDELYSMLMMKWSDYAHPETKPTIFACMRDVMRCYMCGWGSDSLPKRTYFGFPYVVTKEWPPRYVFPSEEANTTGHVEIQGIGFIMRYDNWYEGIYVPIPLGPLKLNPDDLL